MEFEVEFRDKVYPVAIYFVDSLPIVVVKKMVVKELKEVHRVFESAKAGDLVLYTDEARQEEISGGTLK